MKAKTFRLRDCICRKQQLLVGRKCDFPLRTCLGFSAFEAPPSPCDVSREEALAFLDRAEEIGLVHTVSNVMKGVGYVCNCCGCCCGILRGINEWGIENSWLTQTIMRLLIAMNASDAERAGTDVKYMRYQKGTVSVVDLKKCIGCGLCATGCPNGAAKLVRKTEGEILDPPMDFAAWEHDRLHNRGLIK